MLREGWLISNSSKRKVIGPLAWDSSSDFLPSLSCKWSWRVREYMWKWIIENMSPWQLPWGHYLCEVRFCCETWVPEIKPRDLCGGKIYYCYLFSDLHACHDKHTHVNTDRQQTHRHTHTQSRTQRDTINGTFFKNKILQKWTETGRRGKGSWSKTIKS